MIGIKPMTRSELQEFQQKSRKQSLYHYIDNTIYNGIINAAAKGETQCLWTLPIARNHLGGHRNPADVPFTNEEMIEALKEKFPDTTVEAKEEWVETRPGVKEHKKGILIDWS